MPGQNGSGQWRRGHNGDDLTIGVPRGTVVKDITDPDVRKALMSPKSVLETSIAR